MSTKRILLAYAIAPLAGAITITATLLPFPLATLFFLPWIYVICFAIGVPGYLVIRLLPVKSIIIYILSGVAIGMIVALTFQAYYEIFSHVEIQPIVSNLVWLTVRTGLAGGVGFGVFWYFAVRTPNKKLRPAAVSGDD